MKHLPHDWNSIPFPSKLKWLAENYGVYEKGKFGVQGYSKDAPEDVLIAIAEIENEYAEAARQGIKID